MDELATSDVSRSSADRRGFSRRAVVRTAAWSVPAVSLLAAAPAVAASGTPVFTPTWVSDSFRTTTDPLLLAGTPTYASGAQRGAISIALTLTGGSVDSLSCVLTAAGGIVWKNVAAFTRGGTTWAANNGDVAGNGWTVSPLTSSTTAVTTYTFAHGPLAAGSTIYLKMVIDQISNNDFPFDFVFSAANTTSKTVRATGSTTASPYMTGTTL